MRPRRGFTLVELLVVIAILGILAGFVAAGLPGVLRRAKITDTRNTMRQIQTILVAYYTDHNSLPPAYGYVSNLFLKDLRFANPLNRPTEIISRVGTEYEESDVFFLVPWLAALREHGNDSLYDNWTKANGYDTDGDNQLSRLEWAPIGDHQPGTTVWTFGYTDLYRGPGNPGASNTGDLDLQLSDPGPRPLIYVPVNERQARVFRTIIYEMAERLNTPNDPRPFNLDAIAIAAIQTQLSFPAPSYDSFVLISVGPNFVAGTNGLLVDWDLMGLDGFDTAYAELNQYHLLGLATYFMATRDAENAGEGDNELDFDYQARVSRGQGRDSNNNMPGSQPRGDGPLIFVGNL
jgi:prepilin-type N-terminal cleavage/methylation domain-containing protein